MKHLGADHEELLSELVSEAGLSVTKEGAVPGAAALGLGSRTEPDSQPNERDGSCGCGQATHR